MEELQLVARARSHGSSVAIRSGSEEWSYDELLDRSAQFAGALLADADDLSESRIAYLVPPGFDYASVQWAIWRAGGVAVPLSLSATEPELEYTLTDSQSCCVVATAEFAGKISGLCERLGLRQLIVDEVAVPHDDALSLPVVKNDRRAMILYTSGTTSKPKGVGDDSCEYPDADRIADRCVALGMLGSHPAVSAAASHSRNYQYPVLRIVGRCHCRDMPTF